MKKLFALISTVVLLFALTNATMAATVTVGGNFRTWIQNSSDKVKGDTVTTFAFDRLALDFNVDLGNNNGFKNQLQLRSIKTSVNNSTSSSNYGDIRLESFFYQKNLLLEGDEFDIGAFGLSNYLPFKNGYSNAIVVGGLGDGLRMGNVIGAVYSFSHPFFDIALGVADSRPNEACDKPGESFNYSARVNVKPLDGLKIGAGYEIVANKGTTSYDPSLNKDNRMVVDISYNAAPVTGMIEYCLDNPTVDGNSKDNLAAIYGELGFKLGSWQFYAGRGINTTGNLIDKMGSSSAGSLVKVNNNYTVGGIQYTISPGMQLGLEYVSVDEKGNSLGLRYKVNF